MSKGAQNNSKKVAVLTSGGDASGMNTCVRATVRYAMRNGFEVYGVKHGYLGLYKNDIHKFEYSSVSGCVHLGGTILRTARLQNFKEKEIYTKAANNLLDKGINNLIVIGGDGSFRGALDLHKNTELNVVTIPATIDNDMGYTDYTIGFDTACNTVLDSMLKLRDTITSHDRIMVLEVMGRACGDIALYSAVGGGAEAVVVPEAPVDIDKLADCVRRGFDNGKTSTVIVLAEGRKDIKDEIMEKVAMATGRTVNHVALSYLQRGGMPSAFDRVLATRFAVRAVDVIATGQSGRAVGTRVGNIFDMSIEEALKAKKEFDTNLYYMARILSQEFMY